MANAIYPAFKEACLAAGGVDLLNVNVRAILVDLADYTYSAAHDFLDDVAAGSREEVSGDLASKTIAAGVFDAADVTFTGTSGDTCEAIILYIHTGTDSTSRLIAYLDTGVGGLPATLGGDITARWNAGGIFAL